MTYNILVAIASYGSKNDHHLERLIHAYQTSSHSVDIVVLSNVNKAVPHGVELIVGLPTADPWSLPFAHKHVFIERLERYDYFIYSEDDTLIVDSNVDAFISVSRYLKDDEIAGFLRFELDTNGRKHYCDVHGPYHWDATSVCKRGEYVLAHFSNEHAACYVISRAQLQKAIQSGGFSVRPHRGKYDLACTAATDPYTQCGLRKLIPVSHLNVFSVPHLPNRYVGRIGLAEDLFADQISTLLQIAAGFTRPSLMVQGDTTLDDSAYSKDYYEPVNPIVLRSIPQQARNVLCVGTGWGALEVALANRGLDVTALPLDPVIGSCLSRSVVRIVHATITSAPAMLADEAFDCIVISNVLQFLPDPTSVLVAFSRLLKEDACIVAVCPNVKNLVNTLKQVLAAKPPNCLSGYTITGVHVVSAGVVRRWFSMADMRLVSVINRIPGQGSVMARWTLASAKRHLTGDFVAIGKRCH